MLCSAWKEIDLLLRRLKIRGRWRWNLESGLRPLSKGLRRNLSSFRRSTLLRKTRVVVDSTYLLPSLGISVRSLEAGDIQLIRRLRERAEYCYPAPLLAELVAKAAREALKKGLKSLPREALDGFRALLAGLGIAVEVPEPNGLELAAEFWIRGHKDLMDNMAYAHALKTQAYFMTLDETFRRFLSEKGYPLDIVITHRELENVTREGLS